MPVDQAVGPRSVGGSQRPEGRPAQASGAGSGQNALIDQLALGLRAIRSRSPRSDERKLAGELRAALADYGQILDDQFSFLLLTECVAAVAQALSATDSPTPEAACLRELAADGPNAHRHPKATEAWRMITRGGASAPARDSPDGVRLLHAVLRLVGYADAAVPTASADGTRLGSVERRRLLLGALAVNAPDSLWSMIEYRSGMRDTPAGTNGMIANEVALALAAAEVDAQLRIAAARAQLERLNKLNATVCRQLSELDTGRLDESTRTLFRELGISLATVDELLVRRHHFNRANLFVQLLHNDPTGALLMEGKNLLGRWGTELRRCEQAVRFTEQARLERLDGFRPLVGPFEGPPNELLPEVLRPRTDYWTRPAGFTDRISHHLFTMDILPGEDWGRVPVLEYGDNSTVLVSDEQHFRYDAACRAAQAVVLDQMSRAVPGRLTLTWIDPRGRGQSAGPLLSLLETGRRLIDDAVWSEPDDIAAALRRVSDRMSMLEQRALKDDHPHLDAYNAVAGTLAEPNHVLVVTGYPHGFTEESAARLRQIMEGGERLGISVLVVTDPILSGSFTLRPTSQFFPTCSVRALNDPTPRWWSPELLPAPILVGGEGRVHAPQRIGEHLLWVSCEFASFSAEAALAIVRGYASATESAANVKIDARALPTASTGDSAAGVSVPLGLQGRRDTLMLNLGRDMAQNVLIGGMPGSGKSSLLHTLIVSAARAYSPAELELYLLDFKQGVEFQPYATGALPHAKVVAVQSERDFGRSVLRDLRAEIDRRAELLRGPDGFGANDIREYRAACEDHGRDHGFPRIVVVIDEFQVLFSDDDQVAHECAQLLDHVVRQGRAFGVHTVLGTQTLRGHGAMGMLRGTLDQVAVRVVLKTSEPDSRLFLADDNPAGARISRPGQAVFNEQGGSLEGNVEFQIAFTEDEYREEAIRTLRRTADATGFRRRPRVFDGTRPVEVGQDDEVAALLEQAPTDRRRLHLHLGLPVALKGSGAVRLRRAGGNNLVLVHRDPAQAVSALAVALATARLSTADPLRIVGIDSLGVDDEEEHKLISVLDVGDNATHAGHSRMASTLAGLAAEVNRRVEVEDARAERTLLVLGAVQRARALGDENGYAEPDSPREHLLTILNEGPDFGVHTIVVADSVEAVERRLGSGALNAFGARVVGQCSADASQRMIGSAAASRLGEHYVVLHEPDDNRTETLRLFPLPTPRWRELASATAARRKVRTP